MGWEGIHLYDFQLRAAHYGSWEVAAASPDVTLAALRFRKGARFIYEYDLNIPWRHEVRIEDRLPQEVEKPIPSAPLRDTHISFRLRNDLLGRRRWVRRIDSPAKSLSRRVEGV